MLKPLQEIAEIIEVYINQFVMPADPTGDALHNDKRSSD
jgi:hypothetical protein